LAAWSLVRSHSYLGAYLRRQRARRGAPKALTATAHKLARIIDNLLRYGLAYVKPEEAAYAEQVRQRQEKQLQRRAKELGYALTKREPPAAAPTDRPAESWRPTARTLVAPETPPGAVHHETPHRRWRRCAPCPAPGDVVLLHDGITSN
jgi:hypothetical protein